MYVRDRHISHRPSRGEHSRNVRVPRAQKPRARFKLRDQCRERRLLGQQRSLLLGSLRQAQRRRDGTSTRIAFRARHRRSPRSALTTHPQQYSLVSCSTRSVALAQPRTLASTGHARKRGLQSPKWGT